MGFGITGIVNAVTQKALIRYVPKDSEKSLEDIDNEWQSGPLSQNVIVGTLQSIKGEKVKNIAPDVKKGNTVRMTSDITQYALEDGSIVAQHIIQQPLEVVLTFEETNAGKAIGNLIGYAAEMLLSAENQSTYDKLVEIWKDKIQVEITTDQDIYKNMVVKSIPIMEAAPYRAAYKVMCSFVQVTTINQPNAKKGKTSGIMKAVSATVQGGLQVLQKFGE